MDTNKIFIDMARRAHEFAEMCWRMAKEAEQKTDPEAWREENLKKQAAGVKFQRKSCGEWVHPINMFDFSGKKEDYREVPQDVSASECQKALEHLAKTYSADKGTAQLNPTIPPHAAERAFEVWQLLSGNGVADVEPNWHPDFIYRVKPMKLTAKIIRRGVYKTSYYWEFFGTREEYRAECEKYGYVVLSEIKEVKPNTVKYYFALMKNSAGKISVEWCDESNLSTLENMGSGWSGHTIIGDIEEREIEA